MGGKSKESSHESLKYGETLRYDPDFNGPIKNRSCTDVLCFVIFFVFILAWVVVSILAFKFGNPEMLAYPTDSEGNVCGEGKFKDKPYLYFFDLTKCARPDVVLGCPTPQVCIEKCPSVTKLNDIDFGFMEYSLDEARRNQPESVICKYESSGKKKMKDLIEEDSCANYIFKSDPLMGRCIPFINALEEIASNNITLKNNLEKGSEFIGKISDLRNVGEKLFADFKLSWPVILIGLIIAMTVSWLWIIIMRWIAWIMVWLSILLIIGLLATGCWYSFDRYVYLKKHPDEAKENIKLAFNKETLASYKHSKNTWLAFGIITGILLIILFLLILFLRNRIRLAIALIQESSKAVGSIMSSLFFPVIPFILQLGIIAYWLAIALHLSSANFPKHFAIVPSSCSNVSECSRYKTLGDCVPEDFETSCKQACANADCNFMKYDEHDIVSVAQFFNLFGMFWGTFFITGLGEMVLAGAFATWYWTFDKRNVPTFVITASFCRTFRYHLGSLAFGSLLIAIVRMIRVILEYIDRKLKEYTDNAVTKVIMCCLKCCFWCLERFIKFINRNAYIMIAIYGKNFCRSAKDAFFLLMRNIARWDVFIIIFFINLSMDLHFCRMIVLLTLHHF